MAGPEQRIQFIITAMDCDASEIILEMDQYKEIKLPVVLRKGQCIKYTGGDKAIVYNSNWQQINEFDIHPPDFNVSTGNHSLDFDCRFDNVGEKPTVKLEIRTFENGEKIIASNKQVGS